MTYSCTADNLTRTITIILAIVFGGINALQIIILLNHPEESPIFSASILFVFSSVLFLAWGFAPQEYLLNNNKLTIIRFLKNYSIDFNEIQTTRVLTNEEMKNTWRAFGNGGLFGVYGNFKNSKFGKMTYYAKRNKDLIMLELTNGKVIILSPDDREGFVKELKRKA